jgi:copper chaperone CopZ
MTHTYQLTGMTCSGCEATVRSKLLLIDGITSVAVSRDSHSAIISMDKHISLLAMQKALGGENGKYHISATEHNEVVEQTKSWLETYKAILVIFGYIFLVTLVIQYSNHYFDWMQWMRHFMAGFFLVFSFFKILNLKGFADSYAMYDIIARRFPIWGYFYALTELALGLSYLIDLQPILTNIIALLVMSVSIIGVLQSVLNKRKIQCACLGSFFNFPMSTVTIIEDALMILMSATMLFFLNK